MDSVAKLQKELNAGTLSLVLLKVISDYPETAYGWGIAKKLESFAENGHLPMRVGTLYPILRKLEQQNLVSGHLQKSVDGPQRKYLRITQSGRKVLLAWIETWHSNRNFVDAVIEGGPQ